MVLSKVGDRRAHRILGCDGVMGVIGVLEEWGEREGGGFSPALNTID